MPELKTKLIKKFGKNIMIIEEGFDAKLLVNNILLGKTIENLPEKPDVILFCENDSVVIVNEHGDSFDNLPLNLNEIIKDFKREPIEIKPYALPMVEPYYLDETKINSNPHRNSKSSNCKIVRK